MKLPAPTRPVLDRFGDDGPATGGSDASDGPRTAWRVTGMSSSALVATEFICTIGVS